MLGLAGVKAIETRVAAVTVKLAELEVTVLKVALIVDEPMLTPVASPLLSIVAAAVLEEFQVAVVVRFCVEPSV
jgi:hypothetical protein